MAHWMRTACGTDDQVRQLTGRVRSFLCWREEQGAPSSKQVQLLPADSPHRHPRHLQPALRSERPHRACLQGRSEDYIEEEENCPDRSGVLAVAAAMGRQMAWGDWGDLAVQVATGAGLRAGEQFQLTASHVTTGANGIVYLSVDWQWCSDKALGRRAASKHRERRRVPISQITRDGYPLAAELLARAERTRCEQHCGNDQALVIPDQRGDVVGRLVEQQPDRVGDEGGG